MNLKIKIIFVFLFISWNANAQSTRQVLTRQVVWGGLFCEYKITPVLSTTLDVQGRYEYTDGDWVLWATRVGVWYKTKSGVNFGTGLAQFNYYSNPNGKPARPEWRPWEEVGDKIKIGHHTIYPRFRFEQRFIRELNGNVLADKTTFSAFRERFRVDYNYRFNLEKDRGFSFVENQEILFATKKTGFSAMDTFRFSVGFAYAFNKTFSTQLVYLYQLQQKDSNHFEEQEIIRFTLQFLLTKPVKKSE